MNAKVFDQQMEKLKSSFGLKSFEGQKSILIWKYVQNLFDSEFEKIVDHMIASFRYAPLPNDFNEAAKAELKSRYQSGWKERTEKEAARPIDCEWCIDSGFLYCSESDNPTTQFFMLCDCPAGKAKSDDLIPHWSKSVAGAYKRLPFIVKDWVPTGSVTAMGLLDMYRAKLNEGRTYWANLRKKPKPIFRQLWSNDQHEHFLQAKKKFMLESLHAKMESQRGMG